ncbi:MAG: hypothetical protein HKN35_15955 [Woeseia sp.]|nr:hypothetical protein [Woeseia sp.]
MRRTTAGQWIAVLAVGAGIMWMIFRVNAVALDHAQANAEWTKTMRVWHQEMEGNNEAILNATKVLSLEVLPADVREDVLEAVDGIKEDIENKTRDRVFRGEIESLLRNNPDLVPPDGWE